MNREDLLNTVLKTVGGDRQDDYGDATVSHARIADLWTTDLGFRVLPHDVAMMMILLKASRFRTSPGKDDTLIDIVGYAVLAGEMRRE